MRFLLLLFLVFMTFFVEMNAQNLYRDIPSPFFTSSSSSRRDGRSRLLGLIPDKQQHYSLNSIPLNTVAGSAHQTDMYWMSSITTQSYNRGKIGRFYLWDVQGNLRESKMFFDIAGKNKRGLKLVFSKFRFGL